MAKNPCDKAGDTGSIPGPGKFPRATEQLSRCAITTEPTRRNILKPEHLEPALCDKRGHCNERPVHHSKEHPLPSLKEFKQVSSKLGSRQSEAKPINSVIGDLLQTPGSPVSLPNVTGMGLHTQTSGFRWSGRPEQHFLLVI